MHNSLLYIRQLLVDTSGSMDVHRDVMLDILEDHLGEYRRFIARHPNASHRIGFSLFNAAFNPLFGLVSPDEIPEITDRALQLDGNTALLDACWQQLNVLEAYLRAERSEETAQVDLHIITDGIDTASTVVRHADLRQRIETLQSTGRWKFHFPEADLDAIQLSALLGLRRRLAEILPPEQLREALVDFLTPGNGPAGEPTTAGPKDTPPMVIS